MTRSKYFRIYFIGTGDTFSNSGNANQTVFVETETSSFLVDCGPTTLMQAKRLNIDLLAVDTIFLSHIHGDHTLGLPQFLVEQEFILGRKKPLTIVSPEGSEMLYLKLMECVFPDILELGISFEINSIGLAPYSSPMNLSGCQVSVYPMKHSVPVNGYRFEGDGVSFGISGDTLPCDELVELADGLDLLITECSYKQSIPEVPHTSYGELMELSKRFNTDKIVVVHTDGTFDTSPFHAAKDGEIIEISNN